LWGATWGNGYFCVTGENGRVLSSSDSGVTWVDHTATSATTEHLYSVAFADVFIACGTNGVIIMSGLTPDVWTGLASGTSEDLWDISILDAVWTAVGDDDVVVYGNLTTDALDVTVFDTLSTSESSVTDGSVLNASVTDGLAFPQKRFFHDEEDLQIWATAEDSFGASHVLSMTASTLVGVITENIEFSDRAWMPLVEIYENLTFGDTLTSAYSFAIAEDIEFDDTTTTSAVANAALTDTLGVDDTLALTLTMSVTLADDVELSDAALGTGTLIVALSEDIALSVEIESGVLGDEDEDYLTWKAFVVNTRNSAVSEYVRYNFHSFALHNGVYYGANDNGVFTLDNNYDDGFLIKALARLAVTDFNSEFQKRVPRMYLGIRNDGTMILKTITNENVVRWYEMKQNQDGIAKSRVKGTKGVKSAYWQFELANITGDDFDVRAMELMPIVLSRRIK
jgi:hypothetical protein